MLRHSLQKRRWQHQWRISFKTASSLALQRWKWWWILHFYDRCLYANQRHFLWSLRGCVLLFSCAVRGEGAGDVEMAGMTMTLVDHMRVMSSIVLWADQWAASPASPALYGIISQALSSLWGPAPARLKSRFHHIRGSYSQRDLKIPDYFCSISSQHSPGLDFISERQIYKYLHKGPLSQDEPNI